MSGRFTVVSLLCSAFLFGVVAHAQWPTTPDDLPWMLAPDSKYILVYRTYRTDIICVQTIPSLLHYGCLDRDFAFFESIEAALSYLNAMQFPKHDVLGLWRLGDAISLEAQQKEEMIVKQETKRTLEWSLPQRKPRK